MEAPIQTPKTGPVAAYSFDKVEAGPTVEDITGDGHTATIEGATGPKRPLRRRARIRGEGTTSRSRRARIDSSTEEFTLEAWVRPSENDDRH